MSSVEVKNEEVKRPRSRSKSSETNNTEAKPTRKKSTESKPKSPKTPVKRVKSVEKKTAEKKPKAKTEKKPKQNKSETHDEVVTEEVQEKKVKPEKPVKKEHKKRVFNLKPTVMSMQGIGIGPARVKNVLACIALNKNEYIAKEKIKDAENKPKKPKPTKENPNPSIPEQGEQKSVQSLPSNVLNVLHEAEKLHENNLRDVYDRYRLNKFSDDEKDKYDAAKQQYNKTLKDKKFNAQVFNSSYLPTFYNEFADFKNRIDEDNRRSEYEKQYVKNMSEENKNKYNTELKNTKKEAEETGKIFNKQAFNKAFNKKFYDELKTFKTSTTEWTRANELVSKLLIRISIPTRYILASFLDQIVMQYFTNGVKNCVESGKSNIQLKHALTRGSDFENNVPLDKFVRTLDAYNDATNWLQLCETERAKFLNEKKLRKSSKKDKDNDNDNEEENDKIAKFEEPVYPEPNPEQEYNFNNYINDICRHVRMQLAEEVKSDNEKYELYQSLHSSQSFKNFCSYIVYQTIVRIGSSLKFTIENDNKKTISASLMTNTINNICLICGINANSTMSHIDNSIHKYNEYKQSNKKKSYKNNDQSDNDGDGDNDVDNDSEVNIDELSDRE
jgi:hypothetical protein